MSAHQHSSPAVDRRAFLAAASKTFGSVAVAASFENLLRRSAQANDKSSRFGYGPLRPVADETTGLELLQLPAGFRYQSYGWRGDPMTSGAPTPAAHDGMAVIRVTDETITLCRNHEVGGDGTPFGDASMTYDARAAGGCTLLDFDRRQEKFVGTRPALSGTVKNCAGGPTPWGSWLSCEETVLGVGDADDGRRLALEQPHGYIFEVPADRPASPEPLKAMGRFVHEAVAVDPATGIVYETEDRNPSGFYRFLPYKPGELAAGGRLEMAKVTGRQDMRSGISVGQTFDVTWVAIDEPDRAHSPGTRDEQGVYTQGNRQGGATFARLEGCWYGDGRIYLVSTSGGAHDLGQIFEYEPEQQVMRLIFESPGIEVLDSPDNITVSPGGGILLCEDGDFLPQRLHGLSRDGRLFPFAANHIQLNGQRHNLRGDFRAEEWAGATFSPDGKWLFVNIQTPGITFAITGPWADGPLG